MIYWVIGAVTEEIVIAGIETFRIFAHEPAEAGMISSGAVFVEAEILWRPFPASKHEPIVDR